MKAFDMADGGPKADIWYGTVTPERFMRTQQGTLGSHLGIEFVDAGSDWLSARMPVDKRTCQPYGILHGGASVVLAETLGSVGAAWSIDPDRFRAFGQEVNANHIRPASSGWVVGTARPIHRGRRSHVWSIEICDELGRLVCFSRLTVAIVQHD